jgi:excisionase family DNA binding protein
MRSDVLTISVTEAGKHLGLSRNSAYAAAAKGEIPVIRIGKLWRVPVPAFERLLGIEPPTRKETT